MSDQDSSNNCTCKLTEQTCRGKGDHVKGCITDQERVRKLRGSPKTVLSTYEISPDDDLVDPHID
jgi:hypothetical protein